MTVDPAGEMEPWAAELAAMGIRPKWTHLLRSKDGIAVVEVLADDGRRLVLKCFADEAYRREIRIYEDLQSVGVPTIPVVASTARSLLMPDLRHSEQWRLGRHEDLHSEPVATAIAHWYRELHARTEALANDPARRWYSELDHFTKDGIRLVASASPRPDAEVWQLLYQEFDRIDALLKAVPRTLTFNDFYVTNLAVSHDERRALMFDYNLLGTGFRAMDVRNATASLDENAGRAFEEAYGVVDQQERMLDDVVSPITALVMGARSDGVPSWMRELREAVVQDGYRQTVERLLRGN